MKIFFRLLLCLVLPYSAFAMEEYHSPYLVSSSDIGDDVRCYYYNGDYYIGHDNNVTRVLSEDVDEVLHDINPMDLLWFLGDGGYLYVSQLSNGDYRLRAKVRGLGGMQNDKEKKGKRKDTWWNTAIITGAFLALPLIGGAVIAAGGVMLVGNTFAAVAIIGTAPVLNGAAIELAENYVEREPVVEKPERPNAELTGLPYNHRIISFQDLAKEDQNKQATNAQDNQPEPLDVDVPLEVITHEKSSEQEHEKLPSYEEMDEFKKMSVFDKGNFIAHNPRFQDFSENGKAYFRKKWKREEKREIQKKEREFQELQEYKKEHPFRGFFKDLKNKLAPKKKSSHNKSNHQKNTRMTPSKQVGALQDNELQKKLHQMRHDINILLEATDNK